MKALSIIKYKKGFSTLELMIAFAIMSLVFGGVVLADYSAGYWSIASQTHGEAIYKAKTTLENLRAASKGDFYSATSTALVRNNDSSCAAGGLCYWVSGTVSDLSVCSKYAQAEVFWQVPNYPTTTTSLFTNLTNSNEAINLGGDCILNQPAGQWQNMTSASVPTTLGNISGIDVLEGTTYVSSFSGPYLQLINGNTVTNCTNCTGPYNAIDAAHDESNGRTYLYAAASTTKTQLQIIDVTDQSSPIVVGSTTLATITPGVMAPAKSIFAYGRYVFVGIPYISNSANADLEFHIFDVSNPSAPIEVGKRKVTATIYAMLVHDQEINGVTHRFAYLGTSSNGTQELRILDIGTSTPVIISEVPCAVCNLPNNQEITSLAMIGNTLYVGRNDATNGDPDLYAFNVSNPLSGVSILGQKDLGTGRSVVALRASGSLLFVGTQNTTGTSGKIELWNSDPATFSSGAQKTLSLSNLVTGGFDIDDQLYAAGSGSVQKIQSQ